MKLLRTNKHSKVMPRSSRSPGTNNRKNGTIKAPIHLTMDLQELNNEIGNCGHKVVTITNIQQSSIKIPVPLFFIDLQINNIKFLLSARVKFVFTPQTRNFIICMLSMVRTHEQLLHQTVAMCIVRWATNYRLPQRG